MQEDWLDIRSECTDGGEDRAAPLIFKARTAFKITGIQHESVDRRLQAVVTDSIISSNPASSRVRANSRCYAFIIFRFLFLKSITLEKYCIDIEHT